MTELATGMYRLVTDLKIGVSFCTRLPLGSMGANERNCIARASWAMPVAGALVGLTGASVYWLGDRLRVAHNAPQCSLWPRQCLQPAPCMRTALLIRLMVSVAERRASGSLRSC